MKLMRISMIGLFLLLALVAIPAVAAATPSVTISPGSGPRGTTLGVSATGLIPNADHLVQLARGTGNTNTVRLFEDMARSDARGALHYRLAVDQEPGQYSVRVVTPGGTVLAAAPFTVTPGAGTPRIALSPDKGPCATQPTLAGTGFPADSAVAIYQQRLGERGEPAGAARLVTTLRAGASGGFPPFTVPTMGADCRDDAPATPDGTRIRFTAVPPGASPDAATEPERRALFTIERDALAEGRYFPETGFGVEGRFLAYFRAHGLSLDDPGASERESLALFGYPISGEFEQRLEDGRTYTVQYFERARLEYHPENADPAYQVLLGHLGRLAFALSPGDLIPPAGDVGQGRYFPETGHNLLDGPFLDFWLANGGLAVFGYPLTEEYWQTWEEGQRFKVQHYERARFEWHPEHADTPYEVQLAHFGRLVLDWTGGPSQP